MSAKHELWTARFAERARRKALEASPQLEKYRGILRPENTAKIKVKKKMGA